MRSNCPSMVGSRVRDEGFYESAMQRPRHLADVGKLDAAALAGAYGYGLARYSPFVDGNKRAAYVAAELFLMPDRWKLVADDAQCVMTILAPTPVHLSGEGFAK